MAWVGVMQQTITACLVACEGAACPLSCCEEGLPGKVHTSLSA
jgi:hypothetical protein